MSAQISAYGRLGRDPEERSGSTGKVFTTASLAVDASREKDDAPLWLDLVAFGRVSEDLKRHRKGDLLAIVGRLEVRRWKDGEGRDREGLRVVVDHLVSARSVRPGGGSKGSGSESGASSATHPLMEEEIPFAPEVRA